MKLFLAMLIVTTIEVILIAKVGNAIGFLWTFVIIIATALIGSQLLKKQWQHVFGKLQNLQSEPSQAMLEALVLLICGILLITPGFLTDIIGFLGLIPSMREKFVAIMKKHAGGIIRTGVQINTGQDHHSSSQHANDPQIIEGEYEKKED